jgi:16S rRNA (guanine527-N7)-methyltransferase
MKTKEQINDTVQEFLKNHSLLLNIIADFMLEYNAHTNLTRITDRGEITEKHYIDSIMPLILYKGLDRAQEVPCVGVPRGTSLLDVGSGAGFPGILMKLFCPDLQVTLLDSSRKRTDYLAALGEELRRHGDKQDYRIVNGRSEELAHNSEFRERYGVVTARAVANLAALCEYCLAFVQVGGVFLAMKGVLAKSDRLSDCEKVCNLMGAEISETIEYTLPQGDIRNLVVIRKVKKTPADYPRKRTNITKNPIL